MLPARPVLGNRHGQCREQLETSTQPTFCWMLTLLPGRIEHMARSHSRMSPGQASAHMMRSFHTPLSLAPARLMQPSPRLQAKQICVVSIRFGERGPTGAAGTLGARIDVSFWLLAPLTQRCPVDSSRHADATQTESAFDEIRYATTHVRVVHNHIVARGTDNPES